MSNRLLPYIKTPDPDIAYIGPIPPMEEIAAEFSDLEAARHTELVILYHRDEDYRKQPQIGLSPKCISDGEPTSKGIPCHDEAGFPPKPMHGYPCIITTRRDYNEYLKKRGLN